MTFFLDYFRPFAVEIMLLKFTCIVLLLHLFVTRRQALWTYAFTQLGIVMAFASIVYLWPAQGIFAQGHFVLDHLALFLKGVALVAASVILIYAKSYFNTDESRASLYYLLILFSLLGACTLISAHSFLVLYLGLELMSLPVYALIATIALQPSSMEAAIKYFVMGALASAMLLFGISLIYGATGSLDLSAQTIVMATIGAPKLLLVVGLMFIIVGIGFKFGAVPFHLWLPDVYEGSLNTVVTWVAAVPKIAAFGLLVRVLVDSFIAYSDEWQGFMYAMALLSIILGNLAALAQTNIKRMLAYSGISHIGFLFLGVYAMAFPATLFYLLTYVMMTAGAFGALVLLSRKGFELQNLVQLKGLSQTHPKTALCILLIFFSLAGIPPTMGFYAKFSILMALMAQGIIFPAVLGLIFSVVGAFYYLRVIKFMYFDEPDSSIALQVAPQYTGFAVLGLNAALIWLLGIMPGGIMWVCTQVF